MSDRKGPGILGRRTSHRYHAWRMALIHAEPDTRVAMRMLADLARWSAVTAQRRVQPYE